MTVLSDAQIARYELAAGFPRDPRVLAEGVGVVRAESSGNPRSQVPGNEHIGLWAESTAFGSTAQRLNPLEATKVAFTEWKKDGGFWQAWGQWEAQQAGRDGSTTWHAHLAGVKQALAGGGSLPAGAERGAFHTSAPSTNGGSPNGFLVFLVSAVLVLGGVALLAFGGMRTVGSGRRAVPA